MMRSRTPLATFLAILLVSLALRVAHGGEIDAPLRMSTRTLANGLVVAVVENPSVPLATVEVGVHNGSMNEPLPLNGLSHLYEHMFFKGNAVIPDQSVYMEKLRQIGASWNGTTDTERVNYFFTVGADRIDPAMRFMSDAIITPRFDAAELTREKEVVLGEFDRNEADNDYYLQHAVSTALFYKYPTYKDPLGTRASIKAATVAQMQWMQQTYYIPNNSVLIVTGDVQADRIFALAEKYFGRWKKGPNPFVEHPMVKHPPLPAPQVVLVTRPLESAKVRLDWHGPSTGDDMKNAIVADVFSFAANQDGSRFQKALVDSGLAATASVGYSTLRNVGQISVYLETTPDKVLAATRAALEQAGHFSDADYLTDAQWKNAQTLLAVGDLFERERMTEFAHTLTFWFAVDSLAGYQAYIPAIRHATRAEGAAYAARYIVARPMVLGVMASADAQKKGGITKPALEQLLAPWGARAMLLLADKGESPTVESFTVAGIPVLLRPNTASPVVSVATFFRGGSLNLTPENQGIERLALSSAVGGGTESMPREMRSAALDAMGTDLAFETASDYSRIDMKCVSAFFDRSFDLYAQGISQPAFAPSDVDLSRRQQLNQIRQSHEDPDEEVRRISEAFFYRGHPYANRQIGTEEIVARLTPAVVADYFKKLATPARMLIVVVGDTDRAHVQQAILRNLAGLPKVPYADVAPPPVPTRPAAIQSEHRDLPTTYVRGMLPTISPADPDYPIAYLASDILAARLFEEVRTKRNLTYAVWSAISGRRANNGLLYVTSAKPNEAVKVIRETMQEMAATPFSKEELQGHIASLVTTYFQGIETSEDQANQLGHMQLVAGDWRRTYAFVERIRRATPAEVQAAIQRLLRGGVQWAVLGDVKHLDREVFVGAPGK